MLPSGPYCGIDVLRVREQRQGLDRAAGDVDRGDAHSLEVERLEIRLRTGAAVGNEGDRLAVRREGRLHVGELVVRQPAHFLRLGVEEEEVGDAGGLAGDDDGAVVRRPGHVGDGVDAGDAHALEVARVDVDDAEVVVALLEGDEGEALANRPTSCRPNR